MALYTQFMNMTIGDILVEAFIKEREEAQQGYEEAREQGQIKKPLILFKKKCEGVFYNIIQEAGNCAKFSYNWHARRRQVRGMFSGS